MEKQERSPDSGLHENKDSQQFSAEGIIGKVDLSRSITECPGDGEGDRNDTTDMEKLAREDSGR